MTVHSLDEEYRAARTAAVIVDHSHHGRVRVAGRDRIDLIQRLSTNDMRDLSPGRGIQNLFLTNKGRIIAFFAALCFDNHLLFFLPGGDAASLVEWIMRYVFAEHVTAEDVTADTFEFGLYGPEAAAVLGAAGADPGGLAARDHRPLPGFAGVSVGVADPFAGSGFRLFGPRHRGEDVWWLLLEQGAGHGLRAAGPETVEVLRVEAGIPAPGHELTEQWNPLEAELQAALSFTKGCYTGQEVVARLNTYKKVQRLLRGLRLEGKAVPALGGRVLAGGVETGVVTSAVHSPALAAPIALAYVALEQSAAGTELAVEIEPGGPITAAEVVLPPFSAAPAPERESGHEPD